MSDHLSWELEETTGPFREEGSQTRGLLYPGDTACSTIGWKVDDLAEEISKQSVESAAWFLLLLIVKCKRKEMAVMRLEAEDFRQPQKPGRGQKAASLRLFREHGSASILSLNSQN